MGRLEVLQKEHDALQARFDELQRRYETLESGSAIGNGLSNGVAIESSSVNPDNEAFAKKISYAVIQLFDNELYSDVTFYVDGHEIKAHRFVVALRTDTWGDLADTNRIDLDCIDHKTARNIVKWIYTNQVDEELADSAVLALLEASTIYRLNELKQCCEIMLMNRLWSALEAGRFDSARLLLDAGANVNEQRKNTPLLIRAIEAKRDDVARFLLDNKAIAAVTTPAGFSCLSLAVANGLTPTVDYLCRLGANLNHSHPVTGLPPVWTALENADYEIAATLARHGCDCEGWAFNEDMELEETMLHRAIDRNDQRAAIFLIESGCNVNAVRRLPDPAYLEFVRRRKSTANSNAVVNSAASEVNPAICQTPLHASVQWGLTDVTRALLAHPSCKIDAQDYDGRTVAHLAVMEQDYATLDTLLALADPSAVFNVKDRYGYTPLAIAIKYRNNLAAEAICRRIPYAALQINGSGENLLHTSVKSDDLESMLFLLGLQIDVKIPVQGHERLTALHICADVGSELILRNLLLAGADVNATSTRRETALHVAARRNRVAICGILLENGADVNLVDVDGNNALHLAVANGADNAVRLLLDESNVDVVAVNKKRQNILHLCAINVSAASTTVFSTILEAHPKFPLETADIYGNTMFLLAFLNGNAELCRLALRYGACMATTNQHGQSIFNIDTPTKQLLFGLLEGLEREPRWADGDQCSACETKFTLTMRKHHCRHCGRLVCARCSERQMPLHKFNITKNVRVCEICHDVLTTAAKLNSNNNFL